MFFNSKNFKTIEAGVQLTWLQQQLHLQNLSNMETPGYKSKSLVFGDELKNAQNEIARGNNTIRANIVTNDNVSKRPDGNNVDSEVENIELYKASVQYSMLLDKIKGEFTKFGYVLNSNIK